MSRVIALTGAVSAVNVQVKQQTGQLVFECGIPDANAATFADVMARLNAIKVNVDLQSKSGKTETLIPKMALGVLAEIAVSNGGQIDVTDNGVDHTIQFAYEIGASGALQLGDETSIVIDVTGMVANDRVNINAVDFPTASMAARKINIIRFSANAAQNVGLVSAERLHLPKASFDKLELTYQGGKVVNLTQDEVEAWCLNGNGVQGQINGVITNGYVDYYSINVADAIAAKVTLTADANGYLENLVAAF